MELLVYYFGQQVNKKMDFRKNIKRKRFESFMRDQKIALINAVKKNEAIWNIKCKKYSDQVAIKNAWESVSAEMHKDVAECKAAWNGLKDSLRYHRNKKQKSGSAGGIRQKQESVGEAIDWEFAKYMDFLPSLASERLTICSNLTESQPSCSTPLLSPAAESLESLFDESSATADMMDEPSSSSAYSYKPRKPKSKEVDQTDHQLVGIIDRFLNAPKPATREVFPFWNSLLNRLPQNLATDVEVEITNLIHSKIKAYESEVEKNK